MSEPSPYQAQRSVWRRLARLFTKGLAGLVLLLVLAMGFLFVYPSTRPPARTVRPLGTLSVNVPFRLTRPFIDYMALEGPTLYIALASHDLVDRSTRAPAAASASSVGFHAFTVTHSCRN